LLRTPLQALVHREADRQGDDECVERRQIGNGEARSDRRRIIHIRQHDDQPMNVAEAPMARLNPAASFHPRMAWRFTSSPSSLENRALSIEGMLAPANRRAPIVPPSTMINEGGSIMALALAPEATTIEANTRTSPITRILSSLAGCERSGEHGKNGDGHDRAEYERQKCRRHETVIRWYRLWKAILEA